jgi:hypothetical protein
MVIIGEQNEDMNILHIIIGPETDFHFNMSGQSVMDISEYISQFKDGKKCVIVLNQCNSEEELVQELQLKQSRAKAAAIIDQYMTQEKTENYKKEIEKSTEHGLKCPKCLTPNAAIVSDGLVHSCLTCQKIDDGVKANLIPPPPSKETLDKIREQTEINNPQQKRSRTRLFKHNKEVKDGDQKDIQ